MNFSKLKDAANKLLEFIEKYDLDDYNERLVKKSLNELIYVIDTDEMDNIKKDLLEGNLKINNAKLKNQRSKKYYESIRIRK